MNRKEKNTTFSSLSETIVAVATPPGEGGIGIVRLSGPRALAIGRGLFSFSEEPKKIESYRLYMGTVVLSGDLPGVETVNRATARKSDVPMPDGDRRALIDRALFVLMRAPRSYTGQDVVELQCHGSPLLLRSILEAAILLGARPARGGEFTQRAFMNGKIDLVQAEAVADLISAKATGGLSIFSRQLMGALSGRLSAVRAGLVDLLADVEAAVDFSDQDIDVVGTTSLACGIEATLDTIGGLLDSYRLGRVYREGVRVVIAGRPNVGKSSLLNRLLGRSRAIVAPEPGTTRDTIEDVTDIGGVPVRIVDTCGLRRAAGAVEREGIQRTRQALDEADITLLVGEATVGISREERDVLEKTAAAGRPVVFVLNKVDLAPANPHVPSDLAVPIVMTSALLGTGIDELKDAVGSLIIGGANSAREQEIITNARHYAALLSAREALEQARLGATEGIPPECIAVDIRRAVSYLGEVTGDITTDEILEAIFSRFCVGK